MSRPGAITGGLPRRIWQFFDLNPHRELTRPEMQDRFDCSHAQLESALRRLQSTGSIDCVVRAPKTNQTKDPQ